MAISSDRPSGFQQPALIGTLACLAFLAVLATEPAVGTSEDVSPLFGISIPKGYRAWQMIAVSHETEPLNELRGILGNARAIEAYNAGTLPFPDGSVLVKLAWKHSQSTEFPPAFMPGAATTIQIMVKDSIRYAETGGWGFGRFLNGKPVDEAQHRTCYGCHLANVRGHDLVFTRYAP